MSVNTTWTPPPSRLQDHSFGQSPDITPAPSDPYPMRPPARLNGRIPSAAAAPSQTVPPSQLHGFSFSTPATPPKKRRWGLIGLVLFMVIEGSRPVVQDAPLPDKPANTDVASLT
jgi:hypothetical protein